MENCLQDCKWQKRCSLPSTNSRTNEGNVTDPQEIVERFDDCFANAGVEMAEKLDSIDSIVSYCTANRCKQFNFFSPSTAEEVISIIMNALKDEKPVRNCDIETTSVFRGGEGKGRCPPPTTSQKNKKRAKINVKVT